MEEKAFERLSKTTQGYINSLRSRIKELETTLRLEGRKGPFYSTDSDARAVPLGVSELSGVVFAESEDEIYRSGIRIYRSPDGRLRINCGRPVIIKPEASNAFTIEVE